MPYKKAAVNTADKKTGREDLPGSNDAREKKADRIDYICYAYFKFDPVRRVQFYALRVETVALFSSFAYGISFGVQKNKRVIDIRLKGLSARSNSIPSAAPAYAEVLLEELLGEYTVNIIKNDGSVNSAVVDFNIIKKEIILKRKFLPENKSGRLFCDFIIDVNNFSFSENSIFKL